MHLVFIPRFLINISPLKNVDITMKNTPRCVLLKLETQGAAHYMFSRHKLKTLCQMLKWFLFGYLFL